MTNHPLMDFNNHAETTMADMRRVLELSIAEARRQTSRAQSP